MNSISAYTHKSVEWPALYPNWLFVVQRYSSSLYKTIFPNTLDITPDNPTGLWLFLSDKSLFLFLPEEL